MLLHRTLWSESHAEMSCWLWCTTFEPLIMYACVWRHASFGASYTNNSSVASSYCQILSSFPTADMCCSCHSVPFIFADASVTAHWCTSGWRGTQECSGGTTAKHHNKHHQLLAPQRERERRSEEEVGERGANLSVFAEQTRREEEEVRIICGTTLGAEPSATALLLPDHNQMCQVCPNRTDCLKAIFSNLSDFRVPLLFAPCLLNDKCKH